MFYDVGISLFDMRSMFSISITLRQHHLLFVIPIVTLVSFAEHIEMQTKEATQSGLLRIIESKIPVVGIYTMGQLAVLAVFGFVSVACAAERY